MLKATYKKSGYNYQPVILNTETGKRETLWGDPLVTIKDAKKYAQIEINGRKSTKTSK